MDESDRKYRRRGRGGTGSGAYFLGFLGALIYYIQASDGFWQGVLGVLKAIVWPAFVVYELLKFLMAN
ncbi:hypothetical protein [Catelliglobosispora koreensis]|uniref:hypothetical protein n=1 Tax=Catelliglobosispora koreensis TaxID=129052 RepID=UPI00035FD1F9|nr:hypothetical protein [Catelliglobosispora koreensis]